MVTVINAAAEGSRPAAAARWWTFLTLGLLGVLLAARLAMLHQPLGGDEGIYAYIGDRILKGDLPYRDVFEQKPPGVLYTYALIFTLSRSMIAVQLADLLAWGVSVWLVVRFCRRWFTNVAAPGVSAPMIAHVAAVTFGFFFTPVVLSSFKQAGQAETFLVPLTIAAFVLAATPQSGAVAAAGLCCGFAVLFKYNAATYVPAVAVALHLADPRPVRHTLARALTVTAWAAVPAAFVFAYFRARGALGALIDATVRYNLDYAGAGYATATVFVARAVQMTYRIATTNFIWFAGGIGLLVAIVWGLGRGRALLLDPGLKTQDSARRLLVLPVWFAAAYAAILVNGKFYPQYFLQIIPVLSLAAAFVVVSAARAWWQRGYRMAVGLLIVLVVLFNVVRTPFARWASDASAGARYSSGRMPRADYFRRFGGYANGGDYSFLADVQVAEMLRAETTASDTVYIFGGEPLVLFLAERRAAARFLWNDPFLAGAYRGRYTITDLINELERTRPKFFIVLRNDANLVDPVDSYTHFRHSPDLEAYVATHYLEEGWMEDFLIFRRNVPASRAGL